MVRWTLRSHCEVRRTPRFQEGIDISDFRKRCAGEGNSDWFGRRQVRVTIDQGRRTGQDGVIRLTESCEQVTRMPNSQEAPPTGDRVGRGNLSIFLHSTARENFKLMKNGSLTIPIAHMALPLATPVAFLNELGNPGIR